MAAFQVNITGKMLAALRDVFKEDSAIEGWVGSIITNQLRGWLFSAETELCKAERDAMNVVCEAKVEVIE